MGHFKVVGSRSFWIQYKHTAELEERFRVHRSHDVMGHIRRFGSNANPQMVLKISIIGKVGSSIKVPSRSGVVW